MVKVMAKSLDSTALTSEKLEFSTVSLKPDKTVNYHVFSAKEIDDLIASVEIPKDDDA